MRTEWHLRFTGERSSPDGHQKPSAVQGPCAVLLVPNDDLMWHPSGLFLRHFVDEVANGALPAYNVTHAPAFH
jgi:hypothetical protein